MRAPYSPHPSPSTRRIRASRNTSAPTCSTVRCARCSTSSLDSARATTAGWLSFIASPLQNIHFQHLCSSVRTSVRPLSYDVVDIAQPPPVYESEVVPNTVRPQVSKGPEFIHHRGNVWKRLAG